MKKSPISRLNELCNYNGTEPKYSLQSTDGESHKRNFHIRCRVKNLETEAFGSSKQRAKQHTASLMLQSIINSDQLPLRRDVAFDGWNPCDDKSFWVSPENVNESEERVPNSVGKLLQLCLKMKLGAPRFEECEMERPPNKQKWFSVTCFISEFNGLKSNGEGSKKQIAKREAASKMLELISKRDVKPKDVFIFREKFSEYENESESGEDEANNESIKRFIEQLNGTGKKHDDWESLNVLNSTKNKQFEDFCAHLEELSLSNNYQIQYLRIPSPSKCGKHQFLLKVFRKNCSERHSPMFTVWGSGSDSESAKQEAAKRIVTLYFS